jgi:DHA2 family multidrug resistance protein-like MFS transporter
VSDAIAGQPLPKDVANEAKNSLGFALETAQRLGGPAGDALASTARFAFVDGMHHGLIVGAAATALGALIAAVWLPAHAPKQVTEYEAEYEAERGEAEPATVPS